MYVKPNHGHSRCHLHNQNPLAAIAIKMRVSLSSYVHRCAVSVSPKLLYMNPLAGHLRGFPSITMLNNAIHPFRGEVARKAKGKEPRRDYRPVSVRFSQEIGGGNTHCTKTTSKNAHPDQEQERSCLRLCQPRLLIGSEKETTHPTCQ